MGLGEGRTAPGPPTLSNSQIGLMIAPPVVSKAGEGLAERCRPNDDRNAEQRQGRRRHGLGEDNQGTLPREVAVDDGTERGA